jgi:hypothetical protein
MNDDDYINLVFLMRQTPEKMAALSLNWTEEETNYALSLMRLGAIMVEQGTMPKKWVKLIKQAQEFRHQELYEPPVEDFTQANQVLAKFRL